MFPDYIPFCFSINTLRHNVVSLYEHPFQNPFCVSVINCTSYLCSFICYWCQTVHLNDCSCSCGSVHILQADSDSLGVYRSLQNCASGPHYGTCCMSPFWCLRFCWWLLDCGEFVVTYNTHCISGMLSVSGE